MKILPTIALLMSTTVLAAPALSSHAVAQQADSVSDNPTPEQAQNALLQAQVEALQAQLDSLKERMKKQEGTVKWKGAPQFSGDGGWTFKVHGRFQYDVGYVSQPSALIDNFNAPTSTSVPITTGGSVPVVGNPSGNFLGGNGQPGQFGFGSRLRRIRIGAQGAIPGGFNYLFDFDFANNIISFGEVALHYQANNSPFKVSIGNFEPYESLEQITSERFLSFLERSQMNEAFNATRRLGVGIDYAKGDFLIGAGVFNSVLNNLDTTTKNNDEWEVAGRAVYNPLYGENQLHFAANLQRHQSRKADQTFQYRARPFIQTTDIRYVDTGRLSAKSDITAGVEAAGIFGPLHVVAEAQLTKVNAIKPTDVVSINANNAGPALTSPELTSGARLTSDPTFYSAYAEAGYFLTGEVRGYNKAEGKFERTKVVNGFDKGGWGAWQLVGRFDYLDLNSKSGATLAQTVAAPGITTGSVGGCVVATTAAPGTCYVNGGKQYGYQFALNWFPTDYIRFMLDYSYVSVKGLPALTGAGGISGRVGISPGATGFNSSVVGFRSAFDF